MTTFVPLFIPVENNQGQEQILFYCKTSETLTYKEKDYCDNYIRQEENASLASWLMLAIVIAIVVPIMFFTIKNH